MVIIIIIIRTKNKVKYEYIFWVNVKVILSICITKFYSIKI